MGSLLSLCLSACLPVFLPVCLTNTPFLPRSQVSSRYRHLKSEWDAGGSLDGEAERPTETGRHVVLETKEAETPRKASGDGGKERQTQHSEYDNRRSPSGGSWVQVWVVM